MKLLWMALGNVCRLFREWQERRAIARGHINDRSVNERLRAIGAGR